MLKKVVFLDRDGVINRDSDAYVKNVSEFEFLPGSLEAMASLTRGGCRIIIITNQSVIGRGMTTPDGLAEIHEYLKRNVAAEGGRIQDIFFCPHLPEDRCECRKPAPGLIRKAEKTYSIDLASAVMVGDSTKDILCARRAGCGAAVLVRTGNGVHSEAELTSLGVSPDHLAMDLLDAVPWLLSFKAGNA